MDIHLLESEEFEIECLIRNIKGTADEIFIQLGNSVKLEQGKPSLIPFRAHLAARKNPSRELQKCQNKFQELKNNLESIDPEHESEFPIKKIQSRLFHLKGRLNRLKRSKNYKISASETLMMCDQLELIIQLRSKPDHNLNESLASLKNLKTFEIIDLSESEDEFSDSLPVSDQVVCSSESTEEYLHKNNCSDFKPQANLKLPEQSQNLDGAQLNYVQQVESNYFSNQPHVPQNFFSLPQNQNSPYNLPYIQQLPIYNTTDVPAQFINAIPNISQNFPNSNVPVINQHYQPPSRNLDSRNLSQCKISFDGSADGLPVERFLFRLEHMAKTLNISESALVNELSYVLKGNAQDWYWCHLELNPNISWPQFRNDFVNRFQDRRTNYDVRRMVESRKQQFKESCLDFFNKNICI